MVGAWNCEANIVISTSCMGVCFCFDLWLKGSLRKTKEMQVYT
jgi:hypothetical protein